MEIKKARMFSAGFLFEKYFLEHSLSPGGAYKCFRSNSLIKTGLPLP